MNSFKRFNTGDTQLFIEYCFFTNSVKLSVNLFLRVFQSLCVSKFLPSIL